MSGRSDELGPGKPQAGPSHERISRHAQGAGDAEDGDQRWVPERCSPGRERSRNLGAVPTTRLHRASAKPVRQGETITA